MTSTSSLNVTSLTYEVIVPQCQNDLEMIDENEKKRRELNWLIFPTIPETLHIWHIKGWLSEAMMTTNIKLFSSWDANEKHFLNSQIGYQKMTERYTTHDFPNEIINLISNQIMMNLLKPVGSCIFPVMCDEYTDVSNKEQLTFSIRWVNNDLEVPETFLGFYEIPDIKSSTVVTAMKNILLRYQHIAWYVQRSMLRQC